MLQCLYNIGTNTASRKKEVMSVPLPYRHQLIPRAKELRREATRQENHLWYDFLRTYPIRFQRQKTIDTFIADFYCHRARLIVELDGAQHFTSQGTAYDQERTAILQRYGLGVIRFTDREVDEQFASVCAEIDRSVKRRMQML